MPTVIREDLGDPKDLLVPNTIYSGEVIAVDQGNQCFSVLVRKDGMGIRVDRCKWGAGIMSAMLGFKLKFLPPRGTGVKIVYGNDKSIAFGSDDNDLPDGTAPGRTATGLVSPLVSDLKSNKAVQSASDPQQASTPASDLLEGEFEISNMLGVALTMLTNLAKLSAGDRATIECHLLNDMVRIVSETFRHYSSFGNMEIYNDGRLNMRVDGTSYEHEADGRMAEKDPRFSVKQNTVDFSDVDAVAETGRWRFSQYLGFLGDFIHVFVTDPTTTLGKFAEDALRSGKAHVHVGGDGTLLMQSVAEIAIERVARIVVPVEAKRYDDPQGTKKKDFAQLDRSFLKIWNYGTDLKNMAQTAFQLREYARWLSSYHSLARYHQLAAKGGDWKVPTESDIPAPDWTNKETDREAANTGMAQRYKDVYSTWRIMRDGSQVHIDAAGSAVVMHEGDIYMSAVRHLYLDAAGDIIMTAGQNIWMKARRSIEIVSVVGGIRLKARTWLHGLCEWGSVWLKSDAEDPSKSGYAAKTTGDLDWSAEDPLPIVLPQAIMLEATKGQALVQSQRRCIVQTTGAPDDEHDADVIIQSKLGGIQVKGSKGVLLWAREGMVSVKAAKKFLVSTAQALFKAATLGINKDFVFSGSSLSCPDIKARTLSATSGIMGPERPGPSPGGKTHTNHIGTLPSGSSRDPATIPDADMKELDDLATSQVTIDSPYPENDPPVWNFEDPSEYNWAGSDIYESLAQQRIQTDEDLADLYDTWNWAARDRIKQGPRNGNHLPSNGGQQQLTHRGGEDLHKVSSKPPSQQNAQTPLTKMPVNFRFLKRKSN